MSAEVVPDSMKAEIYPKYSGPNSPALKVKILKISPSPTSKLTSNVMASGMTVHDAKVRMPVEITCDVVLEKRSESYKYSIKSIYDMWKTKIYDSSNLSAVKTKDGVLYKNLALANCPHLEDTEHYDAFVFQLKFNEFVFVDGTDYSPEVLTDS